MRKLLTSRAFRCALCLILVCCMIANVVSIRAQASAIPEAAAVVTKVIPFAKVVEPAALGLGGSIFCWAAAAIGVIFTGYQAVQAYNDFQDFTGLLETSIYYYPDGTWSYGVDMGFIERVRAFLFDAGYVISTGDKYEPTAETSLTFADGKVFSIKNTEFTYSVCSYYDTYYGKVRVGELCWWMVYQNGSNRTGYYLDGNSRNGTITIVDSVEYRYYFHEDTNAKLRAPYYGSFSEGSGSRSPEKMFVTAFIAGFVSGSVVSMIEDVKIGTVAPLEIPMPEAYPEWYTNARPATNPDTQEEITVLPIPLNPFADPDEDPDTLTQPDIWQGSIADPMPDSGTDTNPDIGSDGSLANTPWETFKKWISEGWQSIIQAIPTPESIAEAVANVIKSIFVPDADFISEKWNAIRSRFDFADSISSSGELILDVFNEIDPEPPVIYVDLGDAEGSYYLGGQVAFLDLRWYERYKPTGDGIISAFLWLVFVWRVFIKLPGIIGGLPGDFVMQGVTDLGLADRLPARKKEYENQRQENRRFFKK